MQNTKFIISNYLKVSTKKAKWSKVKAKTVDYFKTISIPGVPQIVTTESYLLKLLWIVVILSVFGFGFENISEAVADYYKFDNITNIERVYPENVTFPAITICYEGGYSREHYRNGSLIRNDTVSVSLLEKFLKRKYFYSFKQNNSFVNLNNHLDIFKINQPVFNFNLDCLRFNAVTNRCDDLFKASSILDRLNIFLNNFYRENISNVEYYRYN